MAICIDDSNDSVVDGEWTEELHGCKFLVTSISSTKFQRILNRLNMPFRRKLEKGTMDPSDSKHVLCKAMAKGMVLDWKGIVDKDDKAVPYSEDMAFKLLTNNDIVREFIQDFSSDLDNFYKEADEDLVKI